MALLAVLLAFTSGVIVDLPAPTRSARDIAAYFEDERWLVLLSLVLAIGAAAVFFSFAGRLPRFVEDTEEERTLVAWTGRGVAVVYAAATVPVMILALLAPTDPEPTETLGSLVTVAQVVLFLAIAAFAAVLGTQDTRLPSLLRGTAGIVLLLAISRALAGWAEVHTSLDVVAPLAFLAFLAMVGIWLLTGAHRSGDRTLS